MWAYFRMRGMLLTMLHGVLSMPTEGEGRICHWSEIDDLTERVQRGFGMRLRRSITGSPSSSPLLVEAAARIAPPASRLATDGSGAWRTRDRRMLFVREAEEQRLARVQRVTKADTGQTILDCVANGLASSHVTNSCYESGRNYSEGYHRKS